MAQYHIQGAHKETGEPVDITVTAADQLTAENQAFDLGILISDISKPKRLNIPHTMRIPLLVTACILVITLIGLPVMMSGGDKQSSTNNQTVQSSEDTICSAKNNEPDLLFPLSDLPLRPIPEVTKLDEGKILLFDGRKWQAAGMIRPLYYRTSMVAVDYRNTNEALSRIVVMARKQDVPDGMEERVYSLMIVEQKMIDNRWTDHGICAQWMIRDNYAFSHYVNGKALGTQYEFYPNGQIHIIAEHKPEGQREKHIAWYENGNLQYQCILIDGKEISGKAWNEDGTLRH